MTSTKYIGIVNELIAVTFQAHFSGTYLVREVA